MKSLKRGLRALGPVSPSILPALTCSLGPFSHPSFPAPSHPSVRDFSSSSQSMRSTSVSGTMNDSDEGSSGGDDEGEDDLEVDGVESLPAGSVGGVRGVGGASQPLSAFTDVLSARLRARLEAGGVPSLFPVQSATVRAVCGGRDVVVRSRTGSGKTLGFAIPVAELLERHSALPREGSSPSRLAFRAPRALVLAPTRELARQIEEEFRRVGGLRTVAIYGGAPMGPQIRSLGDGVDVVVGTPGRVQDLINSGHLSLGQVKVAVLDEADEMLKMGFKEEVEAILANTPKEKQVMLWSATMPPWVRTLSNHYLRTPQFIDLVGEDAPKLPSQLKAVAHLVDGEGAREVGLGGLLTGLVGGGSSDSSTGRARVLVFTETRKEVLTLGLLSLGGSGGERVRLGALHGDMTQGEREKTLAAYRLGKLDVLVATDVAARGIDVPDVTHVIQYRIPRSNESFLHRSGRTGRAGKGGTTIMFATFGEHRELGQLEKDLGFEFTYAALPPILPRGLAMGDNGSVRVGEKEGKLVLSSVSAGCSAAAAAAPTPSLTQPLAASLVKEFGAVPALEAALHILLTAASPEGLRAAVDGVLGGGGGQHFSLLTGSRGFATIKVSLPSQGSKSLGPAAAAVLAGKYGGVLPPSVSGGYPTGDGAWVVDVPSSTLPMVVDGSVCTLLTVLPREVLVKLRGGRGYQPMEGRWGGGGGGGGGGRGGRGGGPRVVSFGGGAGFGGRRR